MRAPIRILIAHNAYQQRGGEDSVVEGEIALLRRRGHTAQLYSRHNVEIHELNRLALAADTIWSSRTFKEISVAIRDFQPDVIHVHNTFPLMSPSLYWAADSQRIPVVQTLHNYRLLCPQAMLLREGKVCEACLGRLPLSGVLHGCYRGSRLQTAKLGAMLGVHRALGTYRDKVTRYIALNEFCRAKFVAGGLPTERIVIKPNFVDFGVAHASPRAGLLFVGRLSAEKGLQTLREAMAMLPGARLRVAGEGPEAGVLDGVPGVTRLGRLVVEDVRQEMNAAAALVVPSICYETFGLVVIEAFACGTPVIASRLGALAGLVEDGVTGLLFEPGNAADLAAKMRWALEHPAEVAQMGRNARLEYEGSYTAERNYELLMNIYKDAIDARRAER